MEMKGILDTIKRQKQAKNCSLKTQGAGRRQRKIFGFFED